jgi:NADH-quinone oxidoreductase subunit A
MDEPSALTALAIHAMTVLAVVAAALLLAWILSEKGERGLPEPYESGIRPATDARRATTVPFFLIAAFFVVFDMEAAYLFAWAVAAREAGLVGFVEASIFIVVLLAGLAYLWLDGALEVPVRQRR